MKNILAVLSNPQTNIEFDRTRVATLRQALHRNGLLIFFVAGINALAISSSKLTNSENAMFALSFVVLALGRITFIARFDPQKASAGQLRMFSNGLAGLSLALGVAWAAWVVAGQHMPPNGQMMAAALIAGTVFVALGTLASFPLAYLGFCVPPILALVSIPVHDQYGHPSYTPVLSGSLLVFAIFMLLKHRRVSDQSIVDAIRLHAIEQQHQYMFEHGRTAMVMLNATGMFRISRTAHHLLTLDERSTLQDLRQGFGIAPSHVDKILRRAQRTVSRESMFSLSARFTRKDGTKLWLDMQVCAADAAFPARGLILTLADATARHDADRRNQWLASHDSLTGLANRSAFERRLAILCAPKGPVLATQNFSVLTLDLNGFKAVNDQHGHATGDEVLKIVAKRIRHALHDGDLVCRLGGDEFVVLLESMMLPAHTEQVCETIMGSVGQAIHIEGHLIRLGVAIGVATWPTDAKDPAGLLLHSDKMMYLSKYSSQSHRQSLTGMI